MSDQSGPAAPLQFDRAEFDQGASAAATKCAACGGALGARYWLANEHIVCESCSGKVQHLGADGSPLARIGMATALGLAAGAAGAAIWYAIELMTDARWDIVAIVVGFLVGAAVRRGSGGRGGLAYQALAILITYVAIALTYVPHVLAGLDVTGPLEPLQYVLVFGIAAAAPFLGLPKSIIGVLIIGFALFEAWRQNKRATLVIKGPFEIAAKP
jgi:hypothetical protein